MIKDNDFLRSYHVYEYEVKHPTYKADAECNLFSTGRSENTAFLHETSHGNTNMSFCKNITMVWDAADFQTSVFGTVYNRHWVRNLVAACFSIIFFLFWATITLTVNLSCYRYIAQLPGCCSFKVVQKATLLIDINNNYIPLL